VPSFFSRNHRNADYESQTRSRGFCGPFKKDRKARSLLEISFLGQPWRDRGQGGMKCRKIPHQLHNEVPRTTMASSNNFAALDRCSCLILIAPSRSAVAVFRSFAQWNGHSRRGGIDVLVRGWLPLPRCGRAGWGVSPRITTLQWRYPPPAASSRAATSPARERLH